MSIQIIEHVKAKDIDSLIISLKAKGLGFRKIATELLTKFKIDISHTSISKHYKENLNGVELDKIREQVKTSVLDSLPDQKEDNTDILRVPTIDQQRLVELIEQYKSLGGGIGKVYAHALALCEGNIEAHIEGVDRLRVEYVNYLKTVRAVCGSKII